jgi:5'-3' exoribonuclease 2
MRDLAQALNTYARSATTPTLVSSAEEAGEGEQKIMHYLRRTRPASVAIYGLDADLIVLGLLLGAEGIANVDLFREQMEFGGAGGTKTDVFGDNEFLYMSIDALGAHLHGAYRKTATQSYEEFITDFVGLMSLLGNDFVPHGMTLKIRDEGIEHVLDLYRTVVTQPLLQSISRPLRYNAAALGEIFAALSRDEPARLLKTVCGKLLARPNYMHMKSEEERALARYNDRPLLWGAERCLVTRVAVEGYEHPRFVLRDDWRELYDKHAPPPTAVPAYLQSLSWTLAYYAGESVDMHWYYPWFLPPRFEALAVAVAGAPAADGSLDPPATDRSPLRPLEQLTMVLPRESFHLLPAEFGALLARYPYFWPTDWELYSFGRRYLWECEPLIPLVQPDRIAAMIEEAYEA